MLYALRDILIPLAFSILFYYVLQPVVNFLTKVGVEEDGGLLGSGLTPRFSRGLSSLQPPAVCCSDLCKDSEDSDDEDELSVRRLLGWLGKKKGSVTPCCHVVPTHTRTDPPLKRCLKL